MAETRLARSARGRWVPILITVIAAGLSFAGWRQLVADRRAQVHEVAELAAAQAQRAVASGVREYVVALRNLAGLWGSVGRIRPVEAWRANAEVLIESFPALSYVTWVHTDGSRERVAAGEVDSTARPEPGAPATQADGSLVGPERDPDGAPAFRLFLPVRRADEKLGELEARVNADRLLADVLQQWAPGYALRVRWGSEDLYRRGEPSHDPDLRWWTLETPLALPGATWTVTLAPTAALASAWLTPYPHYLLAVGLVLAIALGLLTRQLQTSFARATELTVGHRTLQANADELRRLNELLEARVDERTQELETLTQSFSHDLKSPLGAILNFSAILDVDHRDQLDDEGRDILARIRRSVLRATALLDGLLRLDRARRAPLEPTAIDMNELARKCYAEAQSSADDRDAEFALEPLPPAHGDRALVAQVLANLLDNALKFTRGCEKRRIVLRGHRSERECVYDVSDSGRGFDMQYAEKLFGVFERLHASQEISGTGVGLALVKKIVGRHGGRVWAEGVVDGGARFTFTLPAAREES